MPRDLTGLAKATVSYKITASFFANGQQPAPHPIFTTLPNDVLCRVLHFLADEEALAVRSTCRSLCHRLEPEANRILLPYRIGMMTGVSPMADIIASIQRLPGATQGQRFDQLAAQCRSLHPTLRALAEAKLDEQRPRRQTAQAFRDRIQRWRDAQPDSKRYRPLSNPLLADDPPTYEAILALPVPEQEAVLTDRLFADFAAARLPPPLVQWRRWCSNASPSARVPLLAALAGFAQEHEDVDGDYSPDCIYGPGAITAVQSDMLATIAELADAGASPALDRLTCAAATLLATRITYLGYEIAPAGWMHACSIVLAGCPILSTQALDAAARSLAFLCGQLSRRSGPEAIRPCWERLLEAVEGRLDHGAIAAVLIRLGEGTVIDGVVSEDGELYRGMLQRVSAMVVRMNPSDRARVSAALLTDYPRNPVAYDDGWRAALRSSRELAPDAREILLAGLCQSLDLLYDKQLRDKLELSLLDDIRRLPAERQRIPMGWLYAQTRHRPLWAFLLISMAAGLPDTLRAGLLLTMVRSGAPGDYVSKKELLNAIGLLEGEALADAVSAAIPGLLYGGYDGVEPLTNRFIAMRSPVSRPFERLPVLAEEVRLVASSLLDAVPYRWRGRVLAGLSKQISGIRAEEKDYVAWLRQEACKLQPGSRYRPIVLGYLINRLHRRATRGSEGIAQEAFALFDALRMSPQERWISALLVIGDIVRCIGLEKDDRFRPVWDRIASLPPEDRMATAPASRKRKSE